MKKINIIYISSIIALLASIYTIIEHQDSQRMQLLAGVFILLGLLFNVVAYTMKNSN
jgi:hypothetical protein